MYDGDFMPLFRRLYTLRPISSQYPRSCAAVVTMHMRYRPIAACSHIGRVEQQASQLGSLRVYPVGVMSVSCLVNIAV